MLLLARTEEIYTFPSGQTNRLYLFECPRCLSHVKRLKVNGSRQNNCGCVSIRHCGTYKWQGYTGLGAYSKWASMLSRCYDPSSPSFPRYGGRGIEVCEEWREDAGNFIGWAFLSGWAPGLEIDRENNDGNYTPFNCRWVTAQENAQNRRSTRATPALVRAIRSALAAGKSGQEIAAETGLSKQTVSKIKLRQQWHNIT